MFLLNIIKLKTYFKEKKFTIQNVPIKLPLVCPELGL